jgi:transcriptional regulator with XRE-family HTH domain
MRNDLPMKELGDRSGKFLTKAFHATGFSRKEGAQRANVSESYLSGLLAGRVIMPGTMILRGMATGWGFNILDYFKALDWVQDSDVETYAAQRGLMGSSAPADVMTIFHKLMAMAPKQRQELSSTLLSMIDTVNKHNGEA